MIWEGWQHCDHLTSGVDFKEFNLGFRQSTSLCTTLKCIEFFHKI